MGLFKQKHNVSIGLDKITSDKQSVYVYEATAIVTNILVESEGMTNVIIEAEGSQHFAQLTSSVELGDTVKVCVKVSSKNVGEALSFKNAGYHPLVNPYTDVYYILVKESR